MIKRPETGLGEWMEHRHRNEDLRNALGALDSQIRYGKRYEPRLQLHVRERIIFAIVTRGRALRGLAHQAIRLAVALQMIAKSSRRPNEKAWLDTLHRPPLDIFRTERFKDLFGRHPSPHILPTADPLVYLLKGPGLDAIDGTPFSLDLKRAPSLGGYLDLVCQMLNFDEVARLVTRAIAEGSAEAAAEEMHGAVMAWLKKNLQSDHLDRQQQVIRKFMNKRHVRSYLDVDDERILSFWEESAPAPPEGLDGFRTWQNAVQLAVAYRAALREAGDALAINGDAHELTATEEVESPLFNIWVSPLAELAESEGARSAVKWFSSKDERALVATFLTERRASDEQGDDLPGNAFADRRPDETLALTWLRYVAFGPRQGSRRSGGNTDAESFARTLQNLNAAAEDLELSCSAAIWALLNAAPEVGLARLARINTRAAIEAFGEAEGVDHDRVQNVLEAFAVVENDDPGSFRTMLMELALAGGSDPEAMRASFRVVGQAEVVEAITANDISIRLAEIVKRDRQAAQLILKAYAVFAAADDRYGSSDPDVGAEKAAAILTGNPEKAKEINDCRSAYARINRAGFRKEDRGSDEVVEALRLGTIHLPDVLAEVRRMKQACEAKDLQSAFEKDVIRFEAVFDQIYAKA